MIRLLTHPLFSPSRFAILMWQVCQYSILAILFLSGNAHAVFNGFQVEPHGIPLDAILSGGPPRDGIPALLSPQFLSANEAVFLSPTDRVLGIQGAHQAKAYPIAILNWHEIVNDSLEGTPVVITYCPLCGTGMGFLRRVGNQLLTFGVSGLLYQSDVLMYDHQTESLWSQISMQAVTGESLGQHLKPVFLEHTTWRAWRERHPQTLVLSQQTGFSRDYSRDPYQHYAQTDRLLFPPARQDDRLSPKEWVLGVEISGKFKAYPFSTLEELGPAFSDSIHSQQYVVCWDGQARSAKILNQQGKPLPTLTAYWFAWYAFHPNTEVFTRDSKQTKQELRTPDHAC
jgi:hypothetical protein